MELQCFFLGEFRVLANRVPVEDWSRPSVARLFKLLVLAPHQTLPVCDVLAQFWPDAAAPNVRQRLHHQIYLLNQALRNVGGHDRAIQLSGNALRFAGGVAVSIDTQDLGL